MILITGSTGFLGRHVLRELTCGDVPVRALVRSPPRSDHPGGAVEYVLGDLEDPESLASACAGAHSVVHLAAKNVDSDGTGFERTNVAGMRHLCAASVGAGVRHLVYVSSVGVYGHGAHRDADESTPVAPDTPFSRSKAAAEALLLAHHRAGDLDATILRHRFVYGEGDTAVIPRLMSAVRRLPFLISGGRARLSFVHAHDLAAVVSRVLDGNHRSTGEDPIYHVTSGESPTFRQVSSTLCRAFGYREPSFSLPRWLLLSVLRTREGLLHIDPETAPGLSSLRVKLLAQDNTFSNARLLRRFPDLRLMTFAEGFARSIDYYRDFA